MLFCQEAAMRSEPLGLDFYIGLPEACEPRVSPLVQAPPPADAGPDLFELIMADPEAMFAKAFTNPPLLPTDANTRAWRAAEISFLELIELTTPPNTATSP